MSIRPRGARHYDDRATSAPSRDGDEIGDVSQIRAAPQATGPSLMTALPMGIADLATMGLLLVLLVSAVTWSVFHGLDRGSAGVAGDVFMTVAVLAASLLAVIAAIRRHRHGLSARPWVALTIACHLWLVGEIIWFIERHYLAISVGVPSWADPFLLLFAPVAAWSFLPAFQRRGRPFGGPIGMLDVVIVAVVVVVALATPIVADRLPGSSLGFGGRLTVMLWVASGMLVALPVVPFVLASTRRGGLWRWPLVSGLLLVGVGNVMYAGGLRDAPPAVSTVIFLGWMTGFVAIAVAAVFGGWQSRAAAASDRSGGTEPLSSAQLAGPTPRTGMAMVMASLLGVVALFVILRSSRTPQFAIGAAVLLVVLVVGRLFLTAFETERLFREVARAAADRRLIGELLARLPADDVRDAGKWALGERGSVADWLVEAIARVDHDTPPRPALVGDAAEVLFALVDQGLAGDLVNVDALADAAARAVGAAAGRIEGQGTPGGEVESECRVGAESSDQLRLPTDGIAALNRDRAVRRITIGSGADTEALRLAVVVPVSRGAEPLATLTLEWAGDGGRTVDLALVRRVAAAVEVGLLSRRPGNEPIGDQVVERREWVVPCWLPGRKLMPSPRWSKRRSIPRIPVRRRWCAGARSPTRSRWPRHAWSVQQPDCFSPASGRHSISGRRFAE